MDRFFDKFPNMYYGGVLCKDLSRRVSINNNTNVQGDAGPFYAYTIKQHLRPDQVSGFYYDDPEMDWMIWMANKAIDPYYDWYLDQFQFNDLIIDKYGSVENANRTIMYWRNNWFNDTKRITPSYYENNIEKKWRKYYEPIWGPKAKILAYKRRHLDNYVTTNRILKYVTAEATFEEGEPVTFHNIHTPAPGDPPTNPNDAVTGKGQIAQIEDSEHLFIQHLRDEVEVTYAEGKQIRGTRSGARAIVTSHTTIFENIPLDETIFWEPVSAWQYEEEINESKKDIQLVGKGIHTFMSQEVARRLKENVTVGTGMSINE